METKRRDYYYTQKIGEYKFLVRVHYMPLFIIRKRVRVGVTMITSKASIESLERALIVNHSDMDYVINKLISKYLEEVDYFKIT
jgi:transposase-like protein